MAKHIRQKRVQTNNTNNNKNKNNNNNLETFCFLPRGASTPFRGVESCSLPPVSGQPLTELFLPFVVRTPHLHEAPTTEETTAGKHDEQNETGKKEEKKAEVTLKWAIPKPIPSPPRSKSVNFHTEKSSFFTIGFFRRFIFRCQRPKKEKHENMNK